MVLNVEKDAILAVYLAFLNLGYEIFMESFFGENGLIQHNIQWDTFLILILLILLGIFIIIRQTHYH